MVKNEEFCVKGLCGNFMTGGESSVLDRTFSHTFPYIVLEQRQEQKPRTVCCLFVLINQIWIRRSGQTKAEEHEGNFNGSKLPVFPRVD